MIKTSLEWSAKRAELVDQMQNLDYNSDLRKMLRGIDGMVVELSRIEVDARRLKSSTKVNEQLQKVNSAINTVEQWIVMAILMQ